MLSVLELKGLRKVFTSGDGSEKEAIRHIDLTLSAGEFVTVIGSNGAGKTTLLGAIAGSFPVDSGSIFLDGLDITNWPEYRRAALIGRVFQNPAQGTAASMTIEENLAMALARGRRRGLRLAVGERERRFFRERLALLGLELEDRLSDPVGLLSGGQRQALALLMATIAQPKLLLLDEHTAALDPKTAVKIQELTERIVADGRLTVLMVTHNLAQALHCGTRTIMMHEGEIVLDVRGEERAGMTVDDLLEAFARTRGEQLLDDDLLLSGDLSLAERGMPSA